MKCPYNHGTVKECIQQTYNDDGFLEKQITLNTRELMKCEREECGAWQNDRCNYNQGTNFN